MNAVAGVRVDGIRWSAGGGFGSGIQRRHASAILLLLVGFSVAGATNEWTKTNSGYWEESYWSLGQMPGTNQELVAFRNPGWKALAIGANTTANYPASLSLNNLLVEAPIDSFNQLLLNWAGFSVPLFVHSNLTIGTNGSLASHYSALRAANAYIDGSASFSDYSIEEFGQLWLRSGGTLNLTNGTMACSNLTLFNGTYRQSGGTAYISANNHSSGTFYYDNSDNSFYLSGGTLYSGVLQLGLSRFKAAGDHDAFYQSGGVHSNSLLNLSGVVLCCPSGNWMGYYSLSGGTLVSDEVDVFTGGFGQSGGTNSINNLHISGGGVFELSGGELVTSNTSCVDYDRGFFLQTGGVHTVRNKLLLDGTDVGSVGYVNFRYSLNGGILNAANIEVGPRTSLDFSGGSGGSVFNTNLFTLRGDGQVLAGGVTNAQFGQLQLTNASPATLSMNTWPNWPNWGPSVLRFQDSHALSWSGSLQILSWHPAYCRIFIGTNSQALTSAQLNAITFVSPVAWPSGNYPATLLPSGELVPAGSQRADSFAFITANGAATITGYIGTQPSITIPGTLNGFPVTAIGDSAFIGENILTNVTIGSGIQTIGYAAFESCSNLISVTIANSVTNISGFAFYECTSLRTIAVPDSVVVFGDFVFGYCTNLASAAIGNGVSAITSATFYNCSGLANVTLGSGITNIGDYAFYYSTNLNAVYFAGNAPTFGSSVFYNASPTIYYLPGTTGWGPTFAGCPTALWFLPNPVILGFGPSFGVHTNRFGFTISWATNVPVVVEACTNLANRTWLPIATTSLTNGLSYFSDLQWSSYPVRFYRLRSP